MEKPKRFARALFGFRKRDVNAYIMELSNQHAARIQELVSRNNMLMKRNWELSHQLAEEKRKVHKL